MSGPPKDMAPADLWLELQRQPRPSRVVRFPRPGCGSVRIIVLTELEQREVLVEARRFVLAQLRPDERQTLSTKALKEDPALRELYADAAARMILCRAVVTVDPVSGAEKPRPTYARVFPDHEAMGRELSADEIALLWTQYQLVQATYSPSIAGMSRAEEDDWVRVLAEGGSEYPLAWLAMSELARFSASLATELYAMRSILASLPPESLAPWESACPTLVRTITSASWLPCRYTESGWTISVPDDHELPDPTRAKKPDWDGDDLEYVDRVRRATEQPEID